MKNVSVPRTCVHELKVASYCTRPMRRRRRSGIDIIYTGQISQIILFWWCTFKRSANYMPFYGAERWWWSFFSRRGFCAWLLCAMQHTSHMWKFNDYAYIVMAGFCGNISWICFRHKGCIIAGIDEINAFNYYIFIQIDRYDQRETNLQIISRLYAIRAESIGCYS